MFIELFLSQALKPAMDDMFGGEGDAPRVRRFLADYDLRRATTRGRPVEAIVFRVGRASKHLAENQKPPVEPMERNRIRAMFDAANLDGSEIPNEEILAQAAGKLSVGIEVIAQRWISTMALAKEDPKILIGYLGLLTGSQILTTLAAEGVRAAFTKWLVDWKEPDGINYRPGQEPAEIAVITAGGIDLEVKTDDPDDDVELDTSIPLLLTLVTGYRISDGAAALKAHTWSGDKPMTIRLCALAGDGSQKLHEVEVKPSALDLGLLLRDKSHIIASLEYAA